MLNREKMLSFAMKPSMLKRFLFFIVADLLLFVLSLFFSFLFHFDLNSSIDYFDIVTDVVAYFVVVKIIVFMLFRIYSMSWRYVSINDLLSIVLALMFSELLLLFLSLNNSFIPPIALTGFPKRIFFADGIISIILVSGLRISKRMYLEVIKKQGFVNRGKRTIILGAGDTGEMILRDMIRLGFTDFYPVGFLDDDKAKIGTHIHGVKVRGGIDRLADIVVKQAVEAVIVAIPSLTHKKLKEIYGTAKKSTVATIKIVPRIYGFDKPDLNLKSLEDISIEDLIGRAIVSVDYKSIMEFLRDKTVLVTGAGGSIGSELVTQICAFQPGRVVLFDIDDTDLHAMSLKLGRHFPQLADRTHFIIGDVRDERRVDEVFTDFKPHVVFHAAAYKHVPMMEHNPIEAVKVNIFGTYVVAQSSLRHDAERFIMVSTDKAVRPTSIMGATKRMAENICRALDGQRQEAEMGRLGGVGKENNTRFVSVRFGNVLGSRGSVIPLFLEQLKMGGPLTVTHKDMVRYFMTIPEAVSLILQASAMGEGGEVFVLDMGEPVKIVELAEELISIQGLVPYRDIDIEFTGVRPGEKIFEELLTAEEGTVASKHEKVFIARNNNGRYGQADLESILKEFTGLLHGPQESAARSTKELLKKYIPHYEEQQTP